MCAVLPVRTSATHTTSCRTSIASIGCRLASTRTRWTALCLTETCSNRCARERRWCSTPCRRACTQSTTFRTPERAVLRKATRPARVSAIVKRHLPKSTQRFAAPPDSPGGSNYHLLCPRKVRREPPGNAGVALCWVCEPVLVSGRHERRWTAYVTTDVFMPL